ncbi:hypothetical protein ACQKMD_15470 [Viridibacillus sp. NPDC096237]
MKPMLGNQKLNQLDKITYSVFSLSLYSKNISHNLY